MRGRPAGLSLSAIAVAAFFALVVLPRATLPMADGDAWWHIHAGEEILATGTVPTTNTWTIAGEGFRWISQDWLSNVGMALLFNAGQWGVAWLSLAFAVAVVGAFALLWSAIGRRSAHAGWLLRLMALTAGLVVAGPIIGIRVQTLDLLLSAAAVWVLWSFLADPRPWRAFLVVPLALAWVNLHAGWVMLFLLGGAVLVGEAVDRLAGRALERQPLGWGPLGWLTLALAGAAAALVANPNGADIYAYPLTTASIAAHRDFLVEWSPPNPASFEGQVILAFLLLGVAPLLVFGARRIPAADLLWLVGISVLALGAARFALFLGPIGGAILALHAPSLLPATRVGVAMRTWSRRLERPSRSSTVARVNAALLAAVVAGGVALAVVRAAPANQAPAIADSVPMRAAAWLDEHAANARIFNTYSWGGYLARRLPQARVFIDGRSDIYGDEPIRRFAATHDVAVDPSVLLDEARIDTVLVRPSAPLTVWLRSSDEWVQTYSDEASVIFRRTEP